jgi:exopolysaccharide biosynthesis polyprenyl glycosylphosphotransferase
VKRHEIIQTVITPILELTWIVGIFFFAYNLRQITDGIPGIQLPIPYISKEQFAPFVLSWVVFWWIIFGTSWLYRNSTQRPLFDVIQDVIIRSGIWFIMYIGFVYLSTGFLFSKEIPRLIIGYVYILSTIFSILLRVWIYFFIKFLYKKNILPKQKVLIIGSKDDELLREDKSTVYTYILPSEIDKIEHKIRNGDINRVLLLWQLDEPHKIKIIKLCSIYAVSFAYPKILPEVYGISQKENFIAWMLVIESTSLKIGAWWRILKRLFDIVLSSIWMILILPLYLFVAILIKWEDPTGPVIFKNRRIGYGWKEFFLYKFRYMYWKYSIKDAYGIEARTDTALKYEEELKRTSDSRDWPLYKIKDDPRKTKVGKIIEKLSIDELPQLWNVFIGDMSLVWPRPHQPREVEHYDEHHFQVLTVKPGITWMAQVFWRDKNTFEDEVRYDVYYIEHFSLLLDLLIIGKTFLVIGIRAFR